jgi:CheY-like chemotaxis protein
MLKGGKLTIETKNVELDEAYATAHFPVRPGHYVMLAVSDIGHGMDAETQRHIFEPFFTTKGKGKGTGLGLSTVYGIVKQNEGYIWVYSEVGRGTTFKIYLPRVDEAVVTAPPTMSAEVVTAGTETILLVEDEPPVRAMVRHVLESRGYRVLEARSSEEALVLTQTQKEPPHMLITDIVMPGMGGRELAEKLRPPYPAMKVLFMSGYTDDAVVCNGVLEPGSAFLQKPFTPDTLLRQVRAVLDTPPAQKS